MKISGRPTIRLVRDGKVEWERSGKNLVVDTGLDLLAAFIAGEAPAVPDWVAIGSSTQGVSAGQTMLVGLEHSRVQFSSKVRVDNRVDLLGVIGGLGGDVTVGEIGVFNAGVDGTMIARWTTTSFVLPAGSSLEVEWPLTVEA